MVACGRCCCICHRFCGIKIESHHIVQEADGGANTIDNCMPLCFDCHADMLSYDDRHPKGTKYRPDELRQHRDRWFSKVSKAEPANYTDDHRDLDKGLFRRLFRLLPWNGSIGFISENNFAGFSFDLRSLRDLDQVYYKSGDPSWEFVDPTLETIRATLAGHISKFIGLIAVNTFPTGAPYRNTVPEEWEYEQEGRFIRVVEEIHGSARDCVDTYKSLVREGRHRLGIEVPKPTEDAPESPQQA